MNTLEIVLLIIGGVIFAASFLIPVKKEEMSAEEKALAEKEIENMAAKQMDRVKNQVDEVMEESMDKTERSLEKLSNEKIMAVSEYSDTVLQEIHKNHEEVMFLYDMLNDKHANLKKTVKEVNRTVKAATESQKEAETVENSFQKLAPEPVKAQESVGEPQKTVSEEPKPDKIVQDVPAADIGFPDTSDGDVRNSNDRILELYRQGKSQVAIARELGLGVGEVKLVVDLYQNT